MEFPVDQQQGRILKRLALLGGCVTVFISILGLLGWILQLPILTSLRPNYIPIALSTCIAFLVQGSILAQHVLNPSSARRWPSGALVAVNMIFGLLIFVGHFAGADLTFEGTVFSTEKYLGGVPVNRMSPLTGLLFSFTGTALFSLLRFGNRKPTPHLACVLGSITGLTGLTGTIAYAYGSPLLYGGTVIPMALTTSAAFMFLGGGLAAAAGPEAFLLKPLGGDSIRAMLLRTFVPLAFLAVIASDIFQHLVGRSNSAFVSAASAICFGIVTVAVVVHAARKLGNAVDKARAERRRAEEERAKMATVIEQAADGILITDRKGNIEYVNPAFERISGYGRGELLGENFRMFRGDQHDEAFYVGMWDCISRGETWLGHVVNRMKDERICEFDTTISPIRDSSGRVVGFVSVNRDVTHEVKLERQLRQAQKMEAIGTLAGGIAHDFNNILGIIMGYTEIILLDTPQGNPAVHSLREIHRAAERARDLVQQILAFSRKGEQKKIPLRVGSIVKEALKFLRPALPVTIEIHQQLDDLPPEGDIVIADPTQVHQVLMNLCTNAAQAMGDKGGVLHVGLSPVEFGTRDLARPLELGPGSYIRLKVSDTGHGMDRAVMERIFEPYFTTKGPGEGTGLGLAVVHGIVRSHGGAITVYSTPGEGTTFHVYLPAAAGRVTSEEVLSQPLPRGNETILFVDDELSLANAGKQMLELLGYRVESRTSSIEALEAFRAMSDKFDLIITDMTMPHMTGLALAEEILRMRPEIPIIVCTGFSSLATPEKVKAAGIRRLLMKPLIMNDLAKLIREVLDERHTNHHA